MRSIQASGLSDLEARVEFPCFPAEGGASSSLSGRETLLLNRD